jgi:hypothetical protein
MENNHNSDKASPITIVLSIIILAWFTYAISYNSSTNNIWDIESSYKESKIPIDQDTSAKLNSTKTDTPVVTNTEHLPKKICEIKWNISDNGRKIYHMPDAPYYSKVTMEPEKWEKWFCTEEEAIMAWWKKEEASNFNASYTQTITLTPDEKAEQEELYRDALRDAENELPSIPSLN